MPADTGMFAPATDEIEITSETGSANASFNDIMEMIRTIGSVTLQGVGTVVGLSQNGQAQLANGQQATLNPQGTYTVRGDWIAGLPNAAVVGVVGAIFLGLALILVVKR